MESYFFYQILSIFLISGWHILMPGHFKGMIAACWIAGIKRKHLLLIAIGYGLSHGLLTGISILAGFFFAGALDRFLIENGLIINNFYLIIAFLAFIYFMILTFKAFKKRKAFLIGFQESRFMKTAKNKGNVFMVGFMFGLIPCSGTVGLMLIAPGLMAADSISLLFLLASWAGVLFTVVCFTLILNSIPLRKTQERLPEWISFAGASLLCFIILIWQIVRVRREFLFLS